MVSAMLLNAIPSPKICHLRKKADFLAFPGHESAKNVIGGCTLQLQLSGFVVAATKKCLLFLRRKLSDSPEVYSSPYFGFVDLGR